MIRPRRIAEDLFFLGAVDRRLAQFENMFELPEGVTYNSYLLLDDKTVLFDTEDEAVAEHFEQALAYLLKDRPLDYLVCNHVEPDHCATLVQVLRNHPETTLLVSKKGQDLLGQFFRQEDWSKRSIQLTEEGITLETGHHRLIFYTAPNVHWPEVTVCYDETEGWLFSADAFGSFKAWDGYLFADQVHYDRDWMKEARRYYVNIVGRQGASVQKLLQKAADLNIRKIFPLHGLLFRTPETIQMILEKYQKWSTYEAEDKGVAIIYGSLYNHSQELADTLAGYLAEAEAGEISVFDVSKTNPSYLTAECFRLSHAVFICNNYNTELYPKMDAFLRELRMLNWDNHGYTLLGNMSWGGRGVKIAEDILSTAKALRPVGNGFVVKSSLDLDQLPELEQLAKEIADSLDK